MNPNAINIWLQKRPLRLIAGGVFLEKGVKLSDDLKSELFGLHQV
jgi:hypothetical protein